MVERESRPAGNGTAINATGEATTSSKSRTADTSVIAARGPLINCESPEQYELVLESWARGWDAAAALYRPRLDNLEAENDRLYLHAYNAPAEVKRILAGRVDAGLTEYADAFLAGAAD
jgi:hypothetical protein